MTGSLPQHGKPFRSSLVLALLILLHGSSSRMGKTRAFQPVVVPSFPRPATVTAACSSSSPWARDRDNRRLSSSWSQLLLVVVPRRITAVRKRRLAVFVAAAAPRYGPSSSSLDREDDVTDSKDVSSIASSSSRSSSQKLSAIDQSNFKQLVQQVMSVRDAHHIPSLLTQNMPLLFSVISASGGTEGVALVQEILNDFPEQDDNDSNDSATRASRQQVEETIDLMLSFAQDFVDQASALDAQNKRLLGKIIKVISPAGDDLISTSTSSSTPKTAWEREEALDHLLERDREFLTAGFLRHLQGECKRIANAPTITPESSRLLELLSMLQTRVLEEMAVMTNQPSGNNNNFDNNGNSNDSGGGGGLGEAAMVLGQLIGYESKAERLAVLEAGLLVRSVEFAEEMRDLTVEALDGFTRVVGGADPGLVQIIQEINERLEQFLLVAARQRK